MLRRFRYKQTFVTSACWLLLLAVRPPRFELTVVIGIVLIIVASAMFEAKFGGHAPIDRSDRPR